MNLSHLSMYVSLNIQVLSAKRTEKQEAREIEEKHGSQKGTFEVRKKLLPPSYLKDILGIASKARQTHYKLTIPTEIENVYILPSTLFERHSEAMGQCMTEFRAAYLGLEAAWDYILSDVVPEYLGRALVPGELPSKRDLPNHFGMRLVHKQIPDSFKDWRIEGVQESDMTQLKARAQADQEELWRETLATVYEKGHSAMAHYIERLNSMEDRAHNFKDVTITNLREFVDIFKKMNIFNDTTLANAASEMEKLVKVSGEELRADVTLVDRQLSAAERIRKALASR